MNTCILTDNMEKIILGIDVGGTKTACASYDPHTLKMLTKHQCNTLADEGMPKVCDQITELVSRFSGQEITGIGIGIPGLVDFEGNTRIVPNIKKSKDFPLADALKKKISAPIFVDNDSGCFALAEALKGEGKGESVVIGITLGTGVGGGIVINGKLFRGSDGFAGEIGHMLLVPGNPPFQTEDERGDVEQFLSGTSLRLRCAKAKKPQELLEGEACEYLHPHLIRECAWLLTSLTHLLNPSVIVLGGSVGLALKQRIPAIEEEWKKLVLPGTPLPKLSVSKNPDAGTLGAALLTVSDRG